METELSKTALISREYIWKLKLGMGSMLVRLILLLTLIPVIEIMLILRVHGWIASSFGSTSAFFVSVGTMVLTGLVGANLAKQQGLGVLSKIQESSRLGGLPAQAIMDGLMVLIGGILLLSPGYITDLFGFGLLFPLTRGLVRDSLIRVVVRSMARGNLRANFMGGVERTPASFGSTHNTSDTDAQWVESISSEMSSWGGGSQAPGQKKKQTLRKDPSIIDIDVEDI